MFTFGFTNASLAENELGVKDSHQPQLNWLPSKEIFPSDAVNSMSNENKNVDIINLGSERLSHVNLVTIIDLMNNQELNTDENILLAEKNHSDLIPGKYEGGLKLWECTHDIGQYLTSSLVTGKTVVDLGCGLGLLGILALKLGAASVIFQDYNADVLRCATIPNVQLNMEESQLAKCQFFSGDWASFAEISSATYDLVVTSETIYNPDNQLKLHDAIRTLLKSDGTALVGAKSYYFGVGGSVRQFEKLVTERAVFDVEVVWKCSQGVQREILKLTFKDVKEQDNVQSV